MNIEVGNLFVVTRGVPQPMDSGLSFSMSRREQTYDRSHEGVVYKALSVAGESIAAEVVFGESTFRKIGSKKLLTATEMLLQVVDQSHLDALSACDVAAEDE